MTIRCIKLFLDTGKKIVLKIFVKKKNFCHCQSIHSQAVKFKWEELILFPGFHKTTWDPPRTTKWDHNHNKKTQSTYLTDLVSLISISHDEFAGLR